MVLASDSRGTFGDPRATTAQNDNMHKLYGISKYVGVVLAGSGEIGSTIMCEIQNEIKKANPPIEGITPVMNFVRAILIKRYNEWFKSFAIAPVQGAPFPIRPTLVLIIGGYEVDENGKPTIQRIYSLNCHVNFAPMLHDYGFALNGVAQYALYLLNRLYKPNLSVDKLLPLGAYVITETASQDGKVGGPVQLMQILPEQGCVTLEEEGINKILQENKLRSEKLQDSFLGEKTDE